MKMPVAEFRRIVHSAMYIALEPTVTMPQLPLFSTVQRRIVVFCERLYAIRPYFLLPRITQFSIDTLFEIPGSSGSMSMPHSGAVPLLLLNSESRILTLLPRPMDRPWRRLLVETMLSTTTSSDGIGSPCHTSAAPIDMPSPQQSDRCMSRTVTRCEPRTNTAWPHSPVVPRCA